jgi:DNA repair protein RecO (recombination protein O)
MLHSTKGIVLRAIRYGETSLIVSVYTKLFGVQSYLVQGVRSEKRGTMKANLYQPATQLELVVYHHPNRNLQRIREAKPAVIYTGIQQDIVRNAIALFLAELMYRSITEPETHPELFELLQETLSHTDRAPAAELNDIPIRFTVRLAAELGFSLRPPEQDGEVFFDMDIGGFVSAGMGLHLLDQANSSALASLLNGEALGAGVSRKQLLDHLLFYLRLHIPHMTELRSPEILHAILH